MIDFSFRHKKGDFLLDVDSSIPGKGVTAIFGPSGCGKTTLLRALSGLEKVLGAKVKINESEWQGNSFKPVHERAIGYVFQEGSLFPHLNVKKNLEYGYKRVQKEQQEIKFNDIIEWLGLKAHLSKSPNELSGGERQRVAIGRALLTSPKLLILDEPLTGLDENSKNEILPYLEKLISRLEIPVLYVSHSTGEVARLAEYIVLMEKGRIVASGPICEIFSRTDLSLARQSDAESIIQTKVLEHDEDYHLSILEFEGGKFTVSKLDKPIGYEIKLRILAKGVSLALKKPEDTSILNIFPATVKDIVEVDISRLNILLEAGGVPILSRITRKSGETLRIKPGLQVYAQIKSVELLT